MGLINAIKNRGLVWVLVHTGLLLFDKFFEYVLFPIAILHAGLVYGTLVMMVLSFFVCWGLIGLYDTVGNRGLRDALGFETVKEVGTSIRKKFRIGAGGFMGAVSKFAAFLYLSVWHDPMTTTILLRPANSYRMDKSSWGTFLWSTMLSNASWGFVIWGGFELIERLFPGATDWIRDTLDTISSLAAQYIWA